MKYYLQNKKTGLFLRGYRGNSPLWTESTHPVRDMAAAYSKEDALKLQKRLECQSQMVELVEKIE